MNPALNLSIIIPAFQAEEFLVRCMQSIFTQTFNNYEVIIVDDSSTDKTAEIVSSYLSNERVKYYKIPHSGVSAARNFGIGKATGEYVLFCDADDEYLPGAFDGILRATVEKADISVFGAEIVNCDPRYTLNDIVPPEIVYTKDIDKVLYLEKSCRPYVWNSVYRRQFLADAKLQFCENICLGEDQVFQFAAFLSAKCVNFVSDKFYRYYFCNPKSSNKFFLENPTLRIERHLDIIEQTFAVILRKKGKADSEYINWVIDFIFADYLALARSERIRMLQRTRSLIKSMSPIQNISIKNQFKLKIISNLFLQRIYKELKSIEI